nr:epoxide hydrolase family protein [Sphingomonas panacis]
MLMKPSPQLGSGSPGDTITPFSVSVPQADLDDLRRRLAATRLPDKESVGDWSQGVPLAKAQSLLDYWQDRYDWRKFEARLNKLPQFRTTIDGIGIHFLHVRSVHAEALPLILTHGWPGSIIEFLDVIEPLVDPVRHGGSAEDAFHLVIPSLPGFGFSDKPVEPGWHLGRTARAWATLMKRLGYPRWVAQGGDWGAGLAIVLAQQQPDGLVAAHVNWPMVFPKELPSSPTPEEQRAIDDRAGFLASGSSYFRQQASRPQTLGYGLADSPIGQAMWIYEKFWDWTDNKGAPEDALSTVAMLDNITLYWLTNSATSSARTYWENTQSGHVGHGKGRVELPMAGTVFPREIFRAPRIWAEREWPNLFYWNELDKGGHFAAFEQPTLFVRELRHAFAAIR